MTPDGDFVRAQEYFERARHLPSGEWERFLARECDDPDLRAYVLRLLLQDVEARFPDSGDDEGPLPERIGEYRIERVHGRGGMGVVYLARQERPERAVALKVIQRRHVSREFLARFRTEVQTLALMNHPSIAQVYSAGVTEDGRPWFAMEFVAGTTIEVYADDARLGLRDRLQLFLAVCDGVQHAHQKAIVHRDIKASNVLVGDADGRAVPKLIDFGIAKPLGPLAGDVHATRAGQITGTLHCMAPEQLDNRDVDTRADVYALGVLLYQLLTGELPHDLETLHSAPLAVAIRTLTEAVPAAPSARVRALPAARASAIAAVRSTSARALVRELRGDLDAIVGRALEKQRDERYQSVSEFAADIRRHLESEPVRARKPGVLYRAGRFARRNKAVVAISTIAVTALALGTVITSVQYVRAVHAERRTAAKEAEARREAETAKQVTEYLERIFRLAKPEATNGGSVTLREVLDRQSEAVRTELAEHPDVQGRVMRAMGEAYIGLGLYGKAVALLEQALPRLEAAYGHDDRVIYDTLNELGNYGIQIGAYDRAHSWLASTLELARRGGKENDVATVLKNLGDVYVKLGQLDAARRALEEAQAIVRRLYPEGSGVEAKILSSLSALERAAGNSSAAVTLAERSLALRIDCYDEGHVNIGHGHFSLGEADLAVGRLDRAHADFEAALAIWEKGYGPQHANVGECLFDLAKVHARLGEKAAAYDYYRRALAIAEHAFDASDPELAPALADWLTTYATFLRDLGRGAEAAALDARASRVRAGR